LVVSVSWAVPAQNGENEISLTFSRFCVTSKNGSSRSVDSSVPFELTLRDVERDGT
jgi:hypothetical protein